MRASYWRRGAFDFNVVVVDDDDVVVVALFVNGLCSLVVVVVVVEEEDEEVDRVAVVSMVVAVDEGEIEFDLFFLVEFSIRWARNVTDFFTLKSL